MPTIGRITFSDPTTTGTFPIVPDFGFGFAIEPEVVVHPFLASSATGAKREQRFQVGSGALRFVVRRSRLKKSDRDALVAFWDARNTSGFQTFTYNCPNATGSGTTAYTVRFEREPLSLDYLIDWLVTTGVTLVQVPTSTPSYSITSTVERFPSAGLETTLAGQQHTIIPLVSIRVTESAVPMIYLSNQRVTVGSNTYEPRLVSWSGISQGIGGESDQAQFVFGNADRVMSQAAADTDFRRARVTFSLYHVGSSTLINLWAGEIKSCAFDQEGAFQVTAADPIYEMTLPYPVRRVSRTCWKTFNDGINCPYSTAGSGGNTSFCDKTFNGTSGCTSHNMASYFGGHYVEVQSAQIKDNATGTWGMGRTSITATSITNPSAYGMAVPEVYTDTPLEVKALIVSGREESDYYTSLGIVSDGPIGSYARDTSDLPKHTLDGQWNHGREAYLKNSSKYSERFFGLRESLGNSPNTNSFSVGGAGAERAANTAFIEVRRTDPKGIQLTRPVDHDLRAWVAQGVSGWMWTTTTSNYWGVLTNPIWICVNAILRARGVRLPSSYNESIKGYASQIIDLQSAIDAAAICNTTVNKLVGAGTETQFKFTGTLAEEKPLKDWLQEILNNCMGYFTFVNGKVRFGIRADTVSNNAFTSGNMLMGSLEVQSIEAGFNHITVQFANSELNWQGDTVTVYDIDHAAKLGSAATPYFTKSQMNLVGTCTRSQAARIGTIRLREELGGVNDTEWKKARVVRFSTTILALDTEPGEVISITDADIPGGFGEFRVLRWTLREDYRIDIEARSVVDSMYDLAVGRTGTDVSPAAISPPVVLTTPGDVRSVTAGTPTLITDSQGKQWYQVVLTYAPPLVLQAFSSVHCWTVRDNAVIDLGVFDYNGDGTLSPPGNGTATVELEVPTGSTNETVRVYVASRNASYDTPLVQGTASTSTPSVTVSLAPGTPISVNPPLQTGMTVVGSDLSTRRGDPATGEVQGLLRATIAYPTGGATRSGVNIWISMDNGTSYEEVGNFAALGTIDFWWPIKDTNVTAKLKVVTFGASGWNGFSSAIESAGFTVTGISTLLGTVISDGTVGALTYAKQSSGLWTWGFTLTWTTPTLASYPTLFAVAATVQKVDASGNAATDYEGTERVFGDRAGSGGQSITIPSNWTIPTTGFKYRIRLYAVDVLQRRTLQTGAFPGGASYAELTPAEPTGGTSGTGGTVTTGAERCDNILSSTISASRIDINTEIGETEWTATGAFTEPADARYGGCRIMRNPDPATNNPGIEVGAVPRGIGQYRTSLQFATAARQFVGTVQAVSGTTVSRLSTTSGTWPTTSNWVGADIYINGVTRQIAAVNVGGNPDVITITQSLVAGSGSACIIPVQTTFVFLAHDTSGRSNTYVAGVTPVIYVSNPLQGGTLNLALASAATLQTAAFANDIRPITISASPPTIDARYPVGSYYFNSSNNTTYKNVGGSWVPMVGSNDIQANAIVAGKIAAGAIRTQEIVADELLVGSAKSFSVVLTAGSTSFIRSTGALFDQSMVGRDLQVSTNGGISYFSVGVIASISGTGSGTLSSNTTYPSSGSVTQLASCGSTPSRFRVNDAFGAMVSFIGDNGSGFVGAYALNLRVGSDINDPSFYADSNIVRVRLKYASDLNRKIEFSTTLFDSTYQSLSIDNIGVNGEVAKFVSRGLVVWSNQALSRYSVTANTASDGSGGEVVVYNSSGTLVASMTGLNGGRVRADGGYQVAGYIGRGTQYVPINYVLKDMNDNPVSIWVMGGIIVPYP